MLQGDMSVERPPTQPRTTARPLPQLARLRQLALPVACACSLALIYLATWQLQTQPAAAREGCTVEQKRPMFVGFARGGDLESFEPAAIASRLIFRSVRQWLCQTEAVGTASPTPSLRSALGARRSLRAEQIQFEDVPLTRAHLVLAELSRGAPRERGWHVHVARGREGWSVARARDQRVTKTTAR